MPDSKTGQRGDLILTFITDYPASLTAAQKELLREAFNR
jgi:DnaJ-class molecular chaperone